MWDYLIPNLTLPEEEEPRFVGVWGQRHLQYLKEYRRTVYLDLLMSGRLSSYLADIEGQAQERFERIVEQMKQAQGITEQLKTENALEWVYVWVYLLLHLTVLFLRKKIKISDVKFTN